MAIAGAAAGQPIRYLGLGDAAFRTDDPKMMATTPDGRRYPVFTPPAAVRAMEVLGDILVEMRHAPDPRVLLEVAFVKLTSAAAGGDLAALAARVDDMRALQNRRAGHGFGLSLIRD